MLTGYLSTLPTDCLLNAGVLFFTKGASYVPIGVTDGAPDFDPGVELGEVGFDNRAASRLKGLTRRVAFAPTFKGTLKELGPIASGSQIAVLEPGVSEAIASGVTTETVKPAGALYAAGDCIVDFRWIFERAGGGFAAFYAPLAIVRKWSAKGNDKKEAAISFEIEAIGDPVNDLSTAPYTVEIRTALPIVGGTMADVRAILGDANILFYGDPSVRTSVTAGGTGKLQTLADARGLGFTRSISAPTAGQQPLDNGVDTLTFDGVDDVLESALDAGFDMSTGQKCLVLIGTLGSSWHVAIIDQVDGSRRFALGTPTGVVRGHTSTANADTTSTAPDAAVRLALANFSAPENFAGDATSDAPWLSADEAPLARAYNEIGSAIAAGNNILSVGGLRLFGAFSAFQLKAILALAINPSGAQLAALQRMSLLKAATLSAASNIVQFIGDSITAAFDGTTTSNAISYAGQLESAGYFSGWIQQNRGTAGRWAETLAARSSGEFSEQINALRAKNTCFVLCGTNDKQGGRTDAQIALDIANVCRPLKAAGAYVVLWGLTRRSGFDVTGINTILATTYGTDPAVCDKYLDPFAAGLIDPTDGTKYAADQLHLLAAGHTLLMNYVIAQVPAVHLN